MPTLFEEILQANRERFVQLISQSGVSESDILQKALLLQYEGGFIYPVHVSRIEFFKGTRRSEDVIRLELREPVDVIQQHAVKIRVTMLSYKHDNSSGAHRWIMKFDHTSHIAHLSVVQKSRQES